MEYLVIIFVIISIVSSLAKSKKKQEEAARRRAQRQQMSPPPYEPQQSAWRPAEPTVVPPRETAFGQGESPAEGTSFERSDPSVPAHRMQAPPSSRNAPPATVPHTTMQPRTQTQPRYWPTNAPASPKPAGWSNPFDLFGELLQEIREEARTAPVRPAQSKAEQPDAEAQQEEGVSSTWSRGMQSGSLGATQGEQEGEGTDIAHYHSRIAGGTISIPPNASPAMADNTAASSAGASARAYEMTATAAQDFALQTSDIRNAIIWSEVLKRPRPGVSPRWR